MQKHIGWLWIIGLVGLLAAADGQTASPSAGTQFDGTYAFVSGTKVKETYTDRAGRVKPCMDLPPRGPLTIVSGHAKHNLQEGTVGPRGELATRLMSPGPVGHAGFMPGWDIFASGKIDENGTVRARWSDYNCSYDLIWQKVPNTGITQFDGTYAFVSSTRVNETYVTGDNRIGQCSDRGAGPLTIINGVASLPVFVGTVASDGELAMRHVPGAGAGGILTGKIDKDGTVKARRTIDGCSRDTIWRKESK